MSVLAQLHFGTGDWIWKVAPESPAPDIEIGFTDEDLPVPFDNLSFGLRVVANGKEVSEASYPPPGVKYVSTDQDYISNDRVQLSADDLVTISVWAENAGVRYDGNESFVIPRPTQPYPSWVWNGDYWEAPVPYPTDGESDMLYVWDEVAGDWVIYTEDGES
jgi:hypothetical protein